MDKQKISTYYKMFSFLENKTDYIPIKIKMLYSWQDKAFDEIVLEYITAFNDNSYYSDSEEFYDLVDLIFVICNTAKFDEDKLSFFIQKAKINNNLTIIHQVQKYLIRHLKFKLLGTSFDENDILTGNNIDISIIMNFQIAFREDRLDFILIAAKELLKYTPQYEDVLKEVARALLDILYNANHKRSITKNAVYVIEQILILTGVYSEKAANEKINNLKKVI